MLPNWLLAPRALRAPEDDNGYEPDPDDPALDVSDDLPPDEDEDLGAGDDVDDELPPVPGDDERPAPRSRENAAVRAARERAQAAERRAADLERQINERLTPREDPQVAEQRFMESIQSLNYEQQMLAIRDRERQLFGNAINSLRAEQQQIRDENKFNALVARNTIAAKHADAVEEEFSRYQRNGTFVSREVILKNILGEQALKRGPAARTRDAARGRANIDGQRGRGAARGSDVGQGRADRNSLEAIEARLRGVNLGDI